MQPAERGPNDLQMYGEDARLLPGGERVAAALHGRRCVHGRPARTCTRRRHSLQSLSRARPPDPGGGAGYSASSTSSSSRQKRTLLWLASRYCCAQAVGQIIRRLGSWHGRPPSEATTIGALLHAGLYACRDAAAIAFYWCRARPQPGNCAAVEWQNANAFTRQRPAGESPVCLSHTLGRPTCSRSGAVPTSVDRGRARGKQEGKIVVSDTPTWIGTPVRAFDYRECLLIADGTLRTPAPLRRDAVAEGYCRKTAGEEHVMLRLKAADMQEDVHIRLDRPDIRAPGTRPSGFAPPINHRTRGFLRRFGCVLVIVDV